MQATHFQYLMAQNKHSHFKKEKLGIAKKYWTNERSKIIRCSPCWHRGLVTKSSRLQKALPTLPLQLCFLLPWQNPPQSEPATFLGSCPTDLTATKSWVSTVIHSSSSQLYTMASPGIHEETSTLLSHPELCVQ